MTPKSPATSVSISAVCGAVVPKKVLKIIEPHANHALKACIDDDYDNNDDCNWLFLPCFTVLIVKYQALQQANIRPKSMRSSA
jgi:hypothetical protein